MAGSSSELLVCDLGVVDYRDALVLQEQARAARQADAIGDVLLSLEHPPVYTRGRRSQPGELPMGEDWYRAQGIDVVATDRGGRLTYHGPGQLVGYPIMRIDDVIAHVREIERAIVAALGEVGIAAGPRERLTGVWVDERKIASIGVHVSRGVTTHGYAVNADNDLQPFAWVVPCGLEGVRMTSITKEWGRRADLADFRVRMARCLAAVHGRTPRAISVDELSAALAPPRLATAERLGLTA